MLCCCRNHGSVETAYAVAEVEDVPERLQISVKVQLNRPTKEFCVQIIVSCHVCEICYNMFLRDSLLSLIALNQVLHSLGIDKSFT